jgi:hypothetical protein
MIEDLIQDLLERLEHKYYGKYRGYVHDVSDPDNRGRIRAMVPRLLGEETPTGWALPSLPYAGPDQGFFTIPELGVGVWIEFEEGDLSKPIWSGMWWGSPQDEDIGTPDSTARQTPPEALQVPPLASEDWQAPSRLPETPQHEYPRQTAAPKVRILKSASGHHIVLDDRPDHERIEVHDSKGNRLILNRNGLERIVANERTYNKGNRGEQVDGNHSLDLAGSRREDISGGEESRIGGDVQREIAGTLNESVNMEAYQRVIDQRGMSRSLRGNETVNISGASERRVSGAIKETTAGGYGLTSGGGVNITSAGSVKVAAGMADLSLNAISMDAFLGNISINTKLGMMQLGGLSALSPLVLGDGLAIHLTILAQILKAVNPLTVAAYGPALDAWAALTPVLDLSYFGFVKRFPVG